MLPSEENRRRFERRRHRVPCKLTQDGEASRGFVVDVSATGLFIETKARYEPGSVVCLRLDPPHGDSFEVTTRVCRKSQKHHAVTVVDQGGGLALQLDGAHEAYFSLVAELLS